MPPAGGFSFTAAQRVIDGIHRHTANMRSASQPSCPSGLPDTDVLMVQIAGLADGSPAIQVDHADFPGGKFNPSVFAFLGDDLRAGSGGSRQRGPFTEFQLHRVNNSPIQDIPDGEAIAHGMFRLRPRHDGLAGF